MTRPGFAAWRDRHGYAREDDGTGLTVTPIRPPSFIDPEAFAVDRANNDAEREMLAALFNFRYLICQNGPGSDEAAKLAGELLIRRIREQYKSARALVNTTRIPVRQRPRSKDE